MYAPCVANPSVQAVLLLLRRVHSDVTPHTCSFCTKSFKHKSSLTTHLRMHTGEQPYSCSVCLKSFTYRSNLSRHIEYHKNGIIAESLGNEAKDPKQISLKCQGHSLTAFEGRAQDEGATTSSSTTNETEYLHLHSSEVPFIINVKQEEDV